MDNSEKLFQNVQYLKSVGPKRAKAFNKAGINSIYDLLFYFPVKYLDRTKLINTQQVIEYVINGYEGEVTIIGKVDSTELINTSKYRSKFSKNIFKVHFRDDTGFFECVWFQGIKYFKNKFNKNDIVAISAKPVISKYGHLQFTHPDFDKLDETESLEFLNTGKIIPFYKLTKELKSSNLGDIQLRKIISGAVKEYKNYINETLPAALLAKNHLPSINKAITEIHFPSTTEKLLIAQKRFKFEELFYLEIIIAKRKFFTKYHTKGFSLKPKTNLIKAFLKTLPFNLTNAQLKTLSEIKKDMSETTPMNRLIQGDVGSGKTIVALVAMLIAIDSGFQCALMAPTEILASQHFENISALLKNFDVKVNLLLGGRSSKEKVKTLKNIETGKSQIVIGTHALIEEQVVFSKLGLIVIDEQHRFGVAQRAKLIGKSFTPDILIMTATPIPRTLSMTLYGDLDISIIDQLPANRIPIQTFVRNENRLPKIYKFIIDKIKEGYQSYIVYPLVEESEKLDLKSAIEYFEKLKLTFFKNIRVGLLHGKMNWQEKESMMKKFAAKEFDVLFSTTVIEVGIDIPDANIILINDAHRFGLSQLHQLRGRVGRSNKQAYCILVTNKTIESRSANLDYNFEFMSKTDIEKSKAAIRLNAMQNISNGFDLSEIDFKLRGPGNIFGKEQSGLPSLIFSDIIKDSEILIAAKNEAFGIINNDPELNNEKNKILKYTLTKKYNSEIDFINIA